MEHVDAGLAAMSECDGILAELRACNGAGFSSARPMPGAIYHSEAFAALERDCIFLRDWICLGRAADLSREGAFATETVADVPVLAVRQADGTIRAYLNVCAHRFAKLVDARAGAKKLFVCPYHSWAYDTAGRLVRAPYTDDVPDFERSEISLRELHTEIWEGFLYISLAKERPRPLAQRLERITDEVIGQYVMAGYETVFRDEMPVAANWKNMIENFIESYHVFAVHAATFGTSDKDPHDYVCGPDMEDCAFHWGMQEDDEGLGAAHADNIPLKGDWRRTVVVGSVFPNHLITLTPGYLWSVTVLPVATGEMRAVWLVAVAPEVLNDIPAAKRDGWVADLRAFMDAANGEDKPVIEALFQGTHMRPGPGHYHPVERNLWNFATYIERMTSG